MNRYYLAGGKYMLMVFFLNFENLTTPEKLRTMN